MLIFITTDQLIESWNDLFFTNQSTLNNCVLRVLTGVLVLLGTWSWQKKNKKLLLPDGWFGYEDYKATQSRFSLLNYLPATKNSLNLIFGIQLVAGICLTFLGIFANIATFVCFATLVSIHNRNIYALSSGDTVYLYLCLFLIFAPSDTQLSILNTAHLLCTRSTGLALDFGPTDSAFHGQYIHEKCIV